MHEIKIDTIGELIGATEERLKQAKYIADVRARNIKNAEIAAVCEYLLGWQNWSVNNVTCCCLYLVNKWTK